MIWATSVTQVSSSLNCRPFPGMPSLVPLILRGVVEVFQDHTTVAITLQTQFAEVRETGVCPVVWFYLCARVGRDESAARGFQGGRRTAG